MEKIFENQIKSLPTVTDYIVNLMDHKKTTWTQNEIKSGDKVLFGFIIDKNTNEKLYSNFLLSELNTLNQTLVFYKYDDEYPDLPVFKQI